MRCVSPTRVGAMMLCAGLATPHAVAEGDFSTVWRPVDNRFSSATGTHTGLAGQYLTFDLFLQGDVGSRINAINMGYAADPNVHDEYIFQNGTVYEHESNGNFAPPEAVFPYEPAIEFDTYLALGDVPAEEMAIVGGSMDFDSLAMRAIWFAVPGGEEWPPRIDETGEMRIMRLTVSADTTQIGGISSRIQIGTVINGNPSTPTVFVTVPISAYAVVAPAPSVAGVFALAGLAMTRRRR